MRRRFFMAPLLLSILFLAGCPPAQETARDAIAGAHGWVQSAQTQWGDSCRANPTQVKCTTTNRLIQLEHTAADSLMAYCGGTPAPPARTYLDGGTCVPVSNLQDGLQSAIQNMNAVVADVKSLFEGGA